MLFAMYSNFFMHHCAGTQRGRWMSFQSKRKRRQEWKKPGRHDSQHRDVPILLWQATSQKLWIPWMSLRQTRQRALRLVQFSPVLSPVLCLSLSPFPPLSLSRCWWACVCAVLLKVLERDQPQAMEWHWFATCSNPKPQKTDNDCNDCKLNGRSEPRRQTASKATLPVRALVQWAEQELWKQKAYQRNARLDALLALMLWETRPFWKIWAYRRRVKVKKVMAWSVTLATLNGPRPIHGGIEPHSVCLSSMSLSKPSLSSSGLENKSSPKRSCPCILYWNDCKIKFEGKTSLVILLNSAS